MRRLKIYIDGMTCQHCVKRVTEALYSLAIEEAEVEIGQALIRFEENKVDIDKIAAALKEAGYELKSWQDQ